MARPISQNDLRAIHMALVTLRQDLRLADARSSFFSSYRYYICHIISK